MLWALVSFILVCIVFVTARSRGRDVYPDSSHEWYPQYGPVSRQCFDGHQPHNCMLTNVYLVGTGHVVAHGSLYLQHHHYPMRSGQLDG